MNKNKHQIVILGGGFGGLRVALELRKRCALLGEYQIVLVDRQAEHLYTPLLYEVATGFLQEPGSVYRGQLREGMSIRFDELDTLIGAKRILYKRADVTGVDPVRKTVTINAEEQIPYDDLVIALGAETAYYGISGLQKHALPLKTLHEAFAIRDRLHAFLKKYHAGKEKKIALVVGGAGATGTEFASEVANFFSQLERKSVIRRTDWSVTLVDAAPNILMAYPDDLRSIAGKRLKQLGVKVMCNAKIKEVKPGVIVIDDRGQEVQQEADVVIWCGGIQPASVLKKLDLPKGPKGHLDVDEALCVRGLENVYALGDCAQFKVDSGFVPALAQAATMEAKVLAENLVRHTLGKPMQSWSAPRTWPSILPMGGAYAIGKIGPIKLQGRLGYLVRKVVDLRYWLTTLPLRSATDVWIKGVKTYLKND